MGLLALLLAGSLAVIGRSDARPRLPADAGAIPSASGSEGNRRIEGRALVSDGDTIEVAGVRIRLEGIDAPEAAQTCETAAGAPWPCGRVATRTLERLIGERRVTCEALGLDKYGRTLGLCRVDGRDINAEMVRQGMAWAFVRYSQRYVREEAEARAQRRGIWTGTATPAWDYRAGHWKTAEGRAPDGCAIKGNVGPNGLIYHMPWSPWYSLIKMDPGKGKRWFCSEDEALRAGWRPALMQ
jgi:endonuclease YncB( thermonuclease family)